MGGRELGGVEIRIGENVLNYGMITSSLASSTAFLISKDN